MGCLTSKHMTTVPIPNQRITLNLPEWDHLLQRQRRFKGKDHIYNLLFQWLRPLIGSVTAGN
ncbi:hypothetical protein L484_008575 [Morus notabilis]|uniref:Uncharacterized protein n=1 Tax=Morus notabilis TaxID=981085 RepID=W9QU98_9ROSA|nr:hypothetical protein L484_008575 [Morus notabilis]